MSESSTDSNSRRRYCECGSEIKRRTSWTDLNPGRRFEACCNNRNSKRGVHFFEWVEKETCARGKEILPGLLRRVRAMEDELRATTENFRKMEEEKNKLEQKLREEIGGLQLLHALDLSNNFSGEIPDQISSLKNMDTLDLSVNHLSGKIPTSLSRLNFLSFFNVSYNNLEGPIPTSTHLQGFNASAFEGNQKLCGAPLPNECMGTNGIDAGNKNNQDVDNGHEIPWVYISLALGFIVGFWGVYGPLMFKKIWRYAYFQFLDNVQDRLYVIITVCVTRMQRRVRI